jgi:hypothetical protein
VTLITFGSLCLKYCVAFTLPYILEHFYMTQVVQFLSYTPSSLHVCSILVLNSMQSSFHFMFCL